MPLILRVARLGLAAALLVALGGWALERRRFGATDEEALTRVEAEVRQRFAETADALGAIASNVARERDAMRGAPRDQAAVKRLFEVADAAVADAQAGRTGVTMYDASAAPLAWTGRVSDLPRARVDGPATLFIAPDALGARLVRIEPVLDQGAPPVRVATTVVEQTLGTTAGPPGVANTFALATSLVPVTLRIEPGPPDATPAQSARDSYSFVIQSPGGGALVRAEVSPAQLAAARDRWLRAVRAAAVSVLTVTLLLCAAATVEIRRRARHQRAFFASTVALIVAAVVARLIFRYSLEPLLASSDLASPVDLLLTALTAAALAWVAVDLVQRRRIARPKPRLLTPSIPAASLWIVAFAAASALGTWLIWVYERVLQRVVSHSDVDLLHFSLHPVDARRLALAFALLLLDAAVIWSAATVLRLPSFLFRAPRTSAWRAGVVAAWIIGAIAGVLVVQPSGPPVPLGPFAVAVVVTAAMSAALTRFTRRLRRASQAERLITLFAALLLPPVALYPSLFAFANEAKELLVAGEYAPEALRQRDDLKLRLGRTLDQIDAIRSLPQLVAAPARTSAQPPSVERAFFVWSATDLALYRLTSAIELYAADGRLVDRFALGFPEYTTTRYFAGSCAWEATGEVAPFGASVRHVLRASRGICANGRPLGAIVVRAMLDYRTLPFIESQSPYLESLRPNRQAATEAAFGRDIEFAVYGWSRAPIFASGTKVWTLPDHVFDALVESRTALWEDVERDNQRFRVYFTSDRGGVYALGYPLITWFGHLINLGELITLAGVLYAALLVASTLLALVIWRTPAGGRALLREVRSSFYRKLFLAFWLVAVVPVAILALATRAYFAAQLRTSIAEGAARTATVAQRLVEDYAALEQRGPGTLTVIDDQIMVLVRRAIDEDVNLFDRDHLQATSARDLFASHVLPLRAPAAVYKSILLDRLPTFVGDERVGDFAYRLAAAPVRAGGREGIVSVPLTSRTQDIEPQLDELDRRVVSAALLFSLLGAAIGYWMAERIADPVNRLSRATRRIARGDLDARIAATSSDELRRLVEDFNQMAADLKRQRAELERTQRIEAWADMARQVAHDIKNPLTPIQLSAEHARRVNIDRGRPLSPVLDECVNAILNQVKLLRQISAEFSSFASSPKPRPEPTSLPALIDEVVEPYRMGLAGRIAVDVSAHNEVPPVTIDRTLFSRALTNVIENALHAMPGTGRLTIESHHRQAADQNGYRDAVVVEVSDTGVGMDPESAARIFEPYFSTKATGTGLGLTIAKRNVELNGGTIDVRSERGVGTTVTIRLPL